MSLHYGNKNITEVYYGSKRIKEIYKGSKLVFGGELVALPSYMILTDGTRIEFDLDNTPVSNLSTTDNSSSSITVNGQSVIKNTIKEIYFGDSYNEVTSINEKWFLMNCANLVSVDLSPFSNVTSIMDGFLAECTSLTSIDLSGLSNVTNIEGGFLYGCTSLTEVKMGAETPPTLGYGAFSGANNLSLISVPCESVDDYKEAFNWIKKADIIKGNC